VRRRRVSRPLRPPRPAPAEPAPPDGTVASAQNAAPPGYPNTASEYPDAARPETPGHRVSIDSTRAGPRPSSANLIWSTSSTDGRSKWLGEFRPGGNEPGEHVDEAGIVASHVGYVGSARGVHRGRHRQGSGWAAAARSSCWPRLGRRRGRCSGGAACPRCALAVTSGAAGRCPPRPAAR
jgi:hypothetical protein